MRPNSTWRKLPHLLDIPCRDRFNVCVNGFLCDIEELGVTAFDFNKEVLNCASKLP